MENLYQYLIIAATVIVTIPLTIFISLWVKKRMIFKKILVFQTIRANNLDPNLYSNFHKFLENLSEEDDFEFKQKEKFLYVNRNNMTADVLTYNSGNKYFIVYQSNLISNDVIIYITNKKSLDKLKIIA